jgi:hypothetical protein
MGYHQNVLQILLLFLAIPVAADEALITARMDPRTELLSAVLMLGQADRNAQGFFLRGSRYEAAMHKHFAPHRNHPVVKRYIELAAQSLDTDNAYSAVMYHTPPPALQARRALFLQHYQAFGGADHIRDFFTLLRQFAKDSDFAGFWTKSASLRHAIEQDVQKQIKKHDAAAPFTAYSGAPWTLRYGFVLSPFAKGVGSATWFIGEPEHREALLGPTVFEKGRLVFHYDWRMRDLWMQAGKEGIAPHLTSAGLAPSAKLYAPLRGCGPNWQECARNQIATAIMGRILALEGYKSAAWELPRKYRRFGQPYVGRLMKKLEQYEGNRKKWPTLASFAPELMKDLAAAAAAGGAVAEFSGSISAAKAVTKPHVFIPKKWVQSRAVAAKIWPQAQVSAAETASGKKVTGQSVIAIGCEDSNAWLGSRWDELHLPLRANSKKMLLTREMDARKHKFRGELRLVTAARNPDSPGLSVAVFCASSDSGAAWLLGQATGHWDFKLFDGSQALKTGMYEKSRNPWRMQ